MGISSNRESNNSISVRSWMQGNTIYACTLPGWGAVEPVKGTLDISLTFERELPEPYTLVLMGVFDAAVRVTGQERVVSVEC